MNLQPEIKSITGKILIGKRLTMSLTDNRTSELWRSFMPRRNEIIHKTGINLISLQVYPENYFNPFNPNTAFEKWALAEVNEAGTIPEGMEVFILPAGEYAVFQHKGTGTEIFHYIFSSWMPASDYELDHRPHFEVLGEKYKNGEPDSEEEIWIPVKPKH